MNAVTIMAWALPRSLATTYGIIIIFFSYRYLDVSVPCVRLLLKGCYLFKITGYPIGKSPDQRLFAPTRSLSQLITSFFASESLGIRHVLFFTYFFIARILPDLHPEDGFDLYFSSFTLSLFH